MTDARARTVLRAPRESERSGKAKKADATAASSLPVVEAWMDVGAEILEFYAERVREDVQLQHDVMHCRHPAEILHFQLRFMQKALDDYHAEYARLAQLSRGFLLVQPPLPMRLGA